jgi:DHA2 family multidrug resistance protein-like MFS transporter
VPSLGVGAAIGIGSALAKAFDRAYVIAGGFLMILAGYAVQATLLHADSHLWVLMVGAGLLASGAVAVMSLGNELMLGAIPPERAGAAAAMNETVTELGGALGMAVLGSIGTAVYRHGLGADVPGPARSTLGGAVATAAHEPSSVGAQLLVTARDDFTHSINVVSIVGAAIMAASALLTILFLRRIGTEAAFTHADTPVAEPPLPAEAVVS